MFYGLVTACFALAIQSIIKSVLKKFFGRSSLDVIVKLIYLITLPIIMYNVVSETMAIISLGYAIKHVFGYDSSLPYTHQTFFALKYGKIANYIAYAIMFFGFLTIINFGRI